MGFFDFLKPKPKVPDSRLGPVYKTPTEASKEGGGYVSTTDPSVPATYQGSASTQQTQRNGGGSGGGGSGGGSPQPTTVQETLKKTGGGLTNVEIQANLRKIQTQQDLRKSSGRSVEVYNPRTNTYKTTRDPYQSYGTREIINTRLPTPEEQRRIDIKESYGVTANLDKLKEDIKETKVVTGKIEDVTKKIKTSSKNIESIDTSIETLLEGKVNDKGEFIGTESEYKNYLRNVEARNKEFSKYEKEVETYDVLQQKKGIVDRDVKFSFFAGEKIVKASSLGGGIGLGYNIGSKQLQVARDLTFEQSGRAVRKIYGETIGKIKVGKQPQAVMDLNTGVYRLATEEDRGTIGKNILSPSKVASATTTFGKMGTSAVTGLWLVDTEEEVRKTGGVVSFIKERPVESALIVGATLLGGSLAVRGFVKNKGIQSAVTKELNLLEGTPLKSVTIVPSGEGRVLARGYRETPSGYQVVTMTGKIQKTEKGFKFLPDGKGTSKIVGVASPTKTNIRAEFIKNELGQVEKLEVSSVKRLTGDNFIFASGQKYQVGVKGTGFQRARGQFEPLRFYENIGVQTSVPKRNIFGMVKVPETKADFIKATKDLQKQLRKERELPPILKEVKLPTGQADYIQINKVLGMKVSKSELGLVIKIPKKVPVKKYIKVKPKVKSVEEQFGLKITKDPSMKSSPEFLKDMFKSQVLVKPKKTYTKMKPSLKKEVLPSLEGIAGEGVVSAQKEIPKARLEISGLPVGGSAYAGTGQYERTEIIPAREVSVEPQRVLVNQNLDIREGTKEIIESRVKSQLKSFVKEKQIDILKPATSEVTREATREAVKERTALRELLTLKSQQKQEQVFKQLQRPKQVQKIEPALKVPVIPLLSSGVLKNLAKKADEGFFEAFAFKGGKEISLGKGTKPEVSARLEKFLTKTLSASGYLKASSGKKVKASETGLLGEGFRKSKKSPFLVVEEKPLRLRRGGTGKDIQAFRPKKGKIKIF